MFSLDKNVPVASPVGRLLWEWQNHTLLSETQLLLQNHGLCSDNEKVCRGKRVPEILHDYQVFHEDAEQCQ